VRNSSNAYPKSEDCRRFLKGSFSAAIVAVVFVVVVVVLASNTGRAMGGGGRNGVCKLQASLGGVRSGDAGV
jgi:hypothetical protein